MSGQGAMMTIANQCPQSLAVSVTGNGMNTLPQPATIHAGAKQDPVYIEAAYFGSSSFSLLIGANLNISFVVRGWAYYVNENATSYQLIAAGILVSVDIQQKGEGRQDIINVTVVPLPASRDGRPSACIYRIESGS